MAIAPVIERTASAHWEGDIATGKGSVATGSGNLSAAYSFGGRFSGEPGTNPEELLGASLASCFTMTLSAALMCSDHAPTSIDTVVTVHLLSAESDLSIARLELETTVVASGIDDASLRELAETAKANCPIGKLVRADDTKGRLQALNRAERRNVDAHKPRAQRAH